jgi:hypothetical protein
MAMRVKNGVEPINCPTDMARGGSRPKPPKAGARSASLEAPRAMADHQTAKRRLTDKTVALDSAKRRALGTQYFKYGIAKAPPLLGVPGAKPPGGFQGRALNPSASPDCPATTAAGPYHARRFAAVCRPPTDCIEGFTIHRQGDP